MNAAHRPPGVDDILVKDISIPPSGKSIHLVLTYMTGRTKGHILFKRLSFKWLYSTDKCGQNLQTITESGK
jgi:hypothetical protein